MNSLFKNSLYFISPIKLTTIVTIIITLKTSMSEMFMNYVIITFLANQIAPDIIPNMIYKAITKKNNIEL